jgi:hypothetical protein
VAKKSKVDQIEKNGRARVKKSAGKKPAAKKSRARKKVAARATKPTLPSDEQIRVRAYFLAEKRTQSLFDGDHNSDWLEAKRQLFKEAGLPLN